MDALEYCVGLASEAHGDMQQTTILVNCDEACPPPYSPVLPAHPRLLLVNQMMHVHGVLAGNRRLNVHVSAEETTRPQVDRDVYRLFDKCN